MRVWMRVPAWPGFLGKVTLPHYHTPTPSHSRTSSQTALDTRPLFGYCPALFSTPAITGRRSVLAAVCGVAAYVAPEPLARPGAPLGPDRERARDSDPAAGAFARRASGGQHRSVGHCAADDDLRPHAAGIQHLPLAPSGHDARAA